MPITLNHSNIGVQYSSDKSYIIETVKSDLYRRNEIVDTIVRDNIQIAPVTPSIYIENGTNNVYAVESYTYSGSANTADFTRVFTKSTTCDILVVGGGGGGGCGMGGGGGGGQVVHATNVNIPIGTYNIIVGSGGAGGVSNNGTNGANSVAFGATANGGGGGGGTGSWGTAAAVGIAGGSGGGGGANSTNTLQASGTVSFGTLGSILASAIRYGNVGGTGKYDTSSGGGGGGGGAGSAGTAGNSISKGNGGNGVIINITGTSYYWAGGGGGAAWATSNGTGGGNGGLGGGGGGAFGAGSDTSGINGLGGINNNIIQPSSTTGAAGANNTGSGGGAGTYNANAGGAGGSGIVIIRYLLGTIPATNYLTNEPVVIAPTFTESIRTFIHSGGTEEQTTHTIIVGQNTICDILIVGGGGGGGNDRGGGGGGGGVIYSQNVTLNGTYTIGVGKGGIGTTSGIPSGKGTRGTNGTNSYISGTGLTTLTAIGGGGGGACASGLRDGLSGGSGGGGSQFNGAGSGGTGTIGQGNNGGIGFEAGAGGGGGGAVAVGTNANSTNAGNGGIGLSNSITGTTVIYGSGGGGGGSSGSGLLPQVFGTGGSIGAGNGGNGHINGNNATVFGCGGGGAGLAQTSVTTGGNGFAGVVIIKFKSTTAILDGITHKRLNFAYEQKYPSISVDNTNLKAWYKFDENYEDSSGNNNNLTNANATLTTAFIGNGVYFDSTGDIVKTVNNFPLFNMTSRMSISCWVRRTAISATRDFIWGQGPSNTYTQFGGTFVEGNLISFYIWGSTEIRPTTTFTNTTIFNHIVYTVGDGIAKIYLNGVESGSASYTSVNIPAAPLFIGKQTPTEGTSTCVIDDFRYYDKVLTPTEISQLYIIPTLNTYTLNFPVPTIADINNNSNIVLRGAYDIALTTTNAVITPKTGQYIPKPTTFTNYSAERMYPPVRNFAASTTTVSGQTYGNGTYVVTFSSTLGSSDPWTCFNTGNQVGGHWASSRYTSGAFNSASFIVAGYLGDWLKIQLPVAIKLTRFEFLMRIETQGLRERSPKDFKIYGSNDNITWVELVNKTDAVYDTSFRYIQLTQDITTAYTYYGLVVNKLLGSTADTLNFDEWYIYGQEVLPSSLSIRYNLLNTILDPIGAQWTYNTSNMNVYNMGSVGVGTTNPEYHLDVSGSLNAKTLMYNGSSINSLGLSVGMIAQVQHLTYTKMELKDNTGWDAINEDLTSGFVIKITPKSSLSKMLVNLIVFIGMSTSAANAWWGIKLYRKIGTGSWTEITGCNGTETGSAAATEGTPVWISNNTGMFSYNESITNASGTYLDSPNTTSTVYYTAYWNQRLGDNPSVTGQMFLNRASSQNDGYRPAPSSSWTVEEIWYG
jgi:hypothetical protein